MPEQKKKIKQGQVLHRVREIYENQKKNALAEVLKEQQAYLDQMQMLEELRQATYAQIKEEQKKNMDTNQMMKYQMYLRQLHIKVLMADTAVKELEKEVQKRRQELIKANQNKVVAEKLLEKQKELLRKEQDYIEVKTLDEIGGGKQRQEEIGEDR